MIDYLIDLLYDRNVEIRKVCDAALSIIGEIDEEWDRKLRRQKFTWHNSEWIKIMTQQEPTDLIEESAVILGPQTSLNLSQDMYDMKREYRSQSYIDSDDEDDDEKPEIGGSNALLYGPL